MKNRKSVIIVSSSILLVCLGLTLLANLWAGFAQWYSMNVYPVFVGSIGRVSSIVPFSISEILIYCTIIYLIVITVVLVVGLFSKKVKNASALATFFMKVMMVATVILLLFTLFAGINYHRRPFSYHSGLTIQNSSTQILYELCQELTSELNQLSQEREEVKLSGGNDIDDISQSSIQAMTNLGAEYEVLSGFYPNPKPLLSSKIMSYAGFTGVYYPLAIEANFNNDVTDYTIPATICHELSHLKGFMREDEANFIAFLACRSSEDTSLQYSGYMLALSYSMNQLYVEDRNLYDTVYAAYSQTMKDDLQEKYKYWKRYEGVVQEASNAVNDTYLKVNNQSDGVKSYGRMVDLLIADYTKRMNEQP